VSATLIDGVEQDFSERKAFLPSVEERLSASRSGSGSYEEEGCEGGCDVELMEEGEEATTPEGAR
jgi:hypothetical protein